MTDLLRNGTPQQLDIYVKRILAKYANEEQILFEADEGEKLPLHFCVDKKLVGQNAYGVKCINEVKITDWEATQEIICNHKARLTITFKVVLWVKYEDNSFGIVVLPDDVYKEDPTACFITNMNEPQVIGVGETLEVIDQDTNPKFKWVKDVPLTAFDAEIPKECFDDPTLQSHLLIKAVRSDYDILNDCKLTQHPVGHNIEGEPPYIENGPHASQGATEILLSIFVDVLDKLGVDQDILIEGIPLDC
ncbi:hypothetical protein [Thermobrachium celere]|uniref:Uncharacterized protein n=1 Tax=Thermobrachium celere DSM 8682 TaxID=941824 RepID=R7RT90_9CLOT|nr:hypothetical protein [Thermobrachium celere]CDF58465.1 hypothetical protein TCEL_00511 [Thermobrachium celere DSM 8682]